MPHYNLSGSTKRSPFLRAQKSEVSSFLQSLLRNVYVQRVGSFVKTTLLRTLAILLFVEFLLLLAITYTEIHSELVKNHIASLGKDVNVTRQQEMRLAGNVSHTDSSLIGMCNAMHSATHYDDKEIFGNRTRTVFYDWHANSRFTNDQCDAFFPGLYKEIDRSFNFWKRHGGISEELLDKAQEFGNVRAAIINRRMYIKWYGGFLINSRAMAILHSINEAVVGSTEPIPDIEFVISNADASRERAPVWAISRPLDTEEPVLIPDFGFWSWPEPGVGSFWDVQEKATLKENGLDWGSKIPKLFWRGALLNDERSYIIRKYKGRSWSAMSGLSWEKKGNKDIISPKDHCDYQYLANFEGHAYSGRLRNIAQCRSVLVMPELKYVQHFTHLLNGDPQSPSRNAVILSEKDLSNLDRVMTLLITQPDTSERIADNSYHFFHFWLSRPSINCYWRKLFNMWASLQRFQPQISQGDPSWQSFSLLGETYWDPF